MIHAIANWFEAHPVVGGCVLGAALDDLYGVVRVVVKHFKRRRAAKREGKWLGAGGRAV